MAVATERLPDSMVSMEIEVAEERFRNALEAAVRRLAGRIESDGVEPEDVPPDVVEQLFGRSRVVQAALETLIPEVYDEAVSGEELEPVGDPEFEVTSMNPLVVSVTVAVQPTVSLGDYRSLRARLVAPEHSADEVNEELMKLRGRFAVLEPADRPIEWDDTVRADVTIAIDLDGGRLSHSVSGAEFRLWPGKVTSLPGFAEQMIGLERGVEYGFAVRLPEDYATSELAGQEARYTVTVREVRQERLPALDDDFARTLGREIESVEQLRASVDTGLRLGAEQTALAKHHDRIVELLLAKAELDYPAVFVEREVDRLLAEESGDASQSTAGLEQWLEGRGQTLEDMRDALTEEAELNVRRAVVLDGLAREEGVDVSVQEIDGRLTEVAHSMAGPDATEESIAQLRESIDTDEGRLQVQSQLLAQAALDRLTMICAGAVQQDSTQPDSGAV